MVIKLSRPIEHDGKAIDSVTVNLDAMTGADALFCEREAIAENGGQIVGATELSRLYLMHVSARACSIPAAVLRDMYIGDFHRITTAVQGFLA
jgi:hypothetical protein